MSRDIVNSENKVKGDIGWDGIIADAEQQIEAAKLRIKTLRSRSSFSSNRRNENVAFQQHKIRALPAGASSRLVGARSDYADEISAGEIKWRL